MPKAPCGPARSEPTKEPVSQRVREGGEVLDRIELDRPCYACMLGGEHGRTLFMVVAKWFGPDRMDELVQANSLRGPSAFGSVRVSRPRFPCLQWS